LELIASENFTSAAVMECLGSVLTNKVSSDVHVEGSVGVAIGTLALQQRDLRPRLFALLAAQIQLTHKHTFPPPPIL
jgi:hypothetical protein